MRLAIAAALLAPILASAASAGTLTKIRDNGPDGNRVVILVIAEGYAATEEAQFGADAENAVRDFFATPPWSSYSGHANAYTDFVASNESGADKPARCYATEVLRDTAFDATYCGNGTQRLVLVDFGAVLTEANAVLPDADLVGVLVNDSEYGGAGGPALTFSTNASARSELLLHEHGHTFAGLADEYTTPYPGYPPGDWEPNVDFDSVRGSVDWDPWIDAGTPLPTPAGDASIGCFEGARYLPTGIYRPKNDCKMRTLNTAFCPICGEAIIQTIYAIVSPLDGATPAGDVVSYDPCDAAASVHLEVTPLLPRNPAWMTASWDADGSPLPDTGFAIDVPVADLAGATRTVTVTLRDATPLVRRAYLDPMTATKTWTLQPGPGPDRDADGVADGCDCAPDDGSAGTPPVAEIAPLRVDRPGRLSWSADAFSHDVARGLVSTLPSGYSGACLDAGTSSALDDPALPGSGAAFWYLVRARNACGTGPWGTDGLGRSRDVLACP